MKKIAKGNKETVSEIKHKGMRLRYESTMLSRMKLAVLLIFGLHTAYSQYPFEKFPTPQLRSAGPWEVYSRVENEGKIHWAIRVPNFYKDSLSMTVQVTSFVRQGKSSAFAFSTQNTSSIRIYRAKKQVQVIIEPYPLGVNFGQLYDSLIYGDINNDSLLDVKIISWGGGNGLASYYHRVIYLFQRADGKFDKVSFTNMELPDRPERDLDGDGNSEIIVTHHEYYKNHSYWVFNLYRFDGGRWQCVNNEFDYPILVQMLYRQNYAVTDKLSRAEMKKFSRTLPLEFSGLH